MDPWIVVATIAVIMTSVQMLPQVFKSLRTRAVRDLSLWMIIIIMFGAASWFAYGLHIMDGAVIIANALNLICATILFVLKVKDR